MPWWHDSNKLVSDIPGAVQWRARLSEFTKDPDLDCDTRGMVPLELVSGKGIRVLIFAGWEARQLHVSFEALPNAPPNWRDFAFPESHDLPVPLTKEIIVQQLLDREEMRAMGDRWLK